MKKHDVEDLNQLYDQGTRVDAELYSEMRSNILLVNGQHYTKRTSKFFARLRNTNRLAEMQKLRITKNHIHKITRHYINSILSRVPGVAVAPQNDSEMQDRKSAELNQAVWQDAKQRYNLKEQFRKWCEDFVEIGEACVKIVFDPNAGELKGYEPQMDPETGMEVLDENGEMVADEAKPIFTGDFIFERIPAYDVFRSPYAKSMHEAPYIGIRKMVDRDKLKKAYANDPDKLKFIEQSEKETYVIFESQKAHYSPNDTEVMLKEFYFKPCRLYPEGYYYIATDFGILEEGPLPKGIFPLRWKGFDEFSGTPRARSIIKVARPYQAEVNRAASQMATHQITVGDDKLVYQSGTKLAPGALLPGVRGLTYQGTPPTVIPGRDGGQFLPYIQQNIQEMYEACMLEEVNQEASQGADPYAMLFASASQQQKFSKYTEKFEGFLAEVCELYLDLARFYLPDDMVIQAIGKSEAINLSEFKTSSKLCYKIKLEAQSETIDSKLGRQLTLTHVLQYVGKQLKPDDIGRILKNMPYVNDDSIFRDLTIDQENVENDMLALERGQQPQLSPYANNEYYVKRLTHRMKQADFAMLDPMIQQGYQMLLQANEQEIVRKQEAIRAAQSEYIPVGGAMITCSMHVSDPENPGKTKQVRLPYQALDWLLKQLESQGMGMEKMENMNQGAVADMAQQFLSQQQQMPMEGMPEQMQLPPMAPM